MQQQKGGDLVRQVRHWTPVGPACDVCSCGDGVCWGRVVQGSLGWGGGRLFVLFSSLLVDSAVAALQCASVGVPAFLPACVALDLDMAGCVGPD
jgi:hypothetical protein